MKLSSLTWHDGFGLQLNAVLDGPRSVMRARPTAVLAASLLITACDKVYFARIDVGPYASQVGIVALGPADHERALAIFRATARELGLSCIPAKYPIITDSYSPHEYQLSSCTLEGDFTQVQLADSPTHVSIEVHKIGGLGEPAFFKKCRTRFAEGYGAAFPSDRVTVRYPYRWGAAPHQS